MNVQNSWFPRMIVKENHGDTIFSASSKYPKFNHFELLLNNIKTTYLSQHPACHIFFPINHSIQLGNTKKKSGIVQGLLKKRALHCFTVSPGLVTIYDQNKTYCYIAKGNWITAFLDHWTLRICVNSSR